MLDGQEIQADLDALDEESRDQLLISVRSMMMLIMQLNKIDDTMRVILLSINPFK